MAKPFDMPFAEFADMVRPSGAVNRFPAIGAGADVFSYSVYMNGPLVAQLPEDAREFVFKDVMLHALTEKMQLDSMSARDNLKVAEIVAVRSAWMSAVLESSVDRTTGLSEAVTADYVALADGLTHPWIVGQLDQQRAMSAKLQPALDRAGAVVGNVVRELPPREISAGLIVAQNDAFTMQKTMDGEVVTHENRRLGDIPEVGSEVVVSYYRGSGQVVGSLANIKVSPPYIFPANGDLAVSVEDGKGRDQVVLFNSISGFSKFIAAHGADKDFVRLAMDLKDRVPKVLPAPRAREVASDVYLDAKTGCLAVDYKERGVTYSALFGSVREMAALAGQFGFGAKAIAAGERLEGGVVKVGQQDEKEMLADLRGKLADLGYSDAQYSKDSERTYVGKVVAESGVYVAQDIGRRVIAIHDLRSLDKVARVGDALTVNVSGGRGVVTGMERSTEKGLGR